MNKKQLIVACIFAIIFGLLIASTAHAIALWEKLAYRKDTIRVCNSKVLVNPLTHELKYIWYDTIPSHTNGHWEPLTGGVKAQFQAMYDQQNGR